MFNINKKDICAVIITYNIKSKIYECVNSIKEQVQFVLIIDNHSDDETINCLNGLEKQENLGIIYNENNIGIAAALNIGIKKAVELGYSWVLTLDHDSICNDKMIIEFSEAYKKIQQKEDVGVICPRIYDTKGEFYLTDTENDISIVNTTIQSGSLINCNVFKKIGFFKEELFIYYVDEEFFYRVRNIGYKIIRVKNSILYHEEGDKVQRNLLGFKTHYNQYSKYAVYYIIRNSIYMIKMDTSTYLLTCIKRIIGVFAKILLFDKQKKSKLKYVFLGLIDALKCKTGSMN